MSSTAQRRVSGYDPRNDLGYLWRDVWFAYYKTLSDILQRGWLYASGQTPDTTPRILESPESLGEDEFMASRLRQRAELKNIEAINESFLLKETTFPKATERNEDVEAWAEAVMSNWRVMCGPTWQDEELGEGGKSAAARGVLDILYRAATKTYHSTQILRYLFTVHASLAEFDLAFKAYDSYHEIVTRGKEKAAKGGEDDATQDDDDTVLRTASEAIRILCRFGSRKEAEKAKEIGERTEKWLEEHVASVLPSQLTGEDVEDPSDLPVSPKTVSIAYRAIAMSSAHWARLTYDAKARAGLQAHAIQCFGKALDPRYEDQLNVETRYALGLLLAEMRDIPGAIKVVKHALAPVSKEMPNLAPDGVISDDERAATTAGFVQERKSVPLWHLLGLLLTARSEFETAGRACDAVFEQFQDPEVLFGVVDAQQFKSDHLNELSATSLDEKTSRRKTKGLVDRMEAFEKESLLQVKMTQLALVETLEGTNAAVDNCDQLLGLYARLFGDPSSAPLNLQPTASFLSPPKTASSFRESILGRSRNSKRMSFRPKSMAPSSTTIASRPSTMATTTNAAAPTIQVTDEDTMQNGSKHSHHLHLSHHSDRPSSRRSESVKLKKRRSMRSIAENEPFPPVPRTSDEPMPAMPSSQPKQSADEPQYHALSSDEERPAAQSLSPIPHNISNEKTPPPSGQHPQPPRQDVRLPAPFPTPSDTVDYVALEPRLPTMQERRLKISLLVQVWLFTSGLYTRAAMYEDAKGATNEASKLVQAFESEVSREDPSVRGFATRGWGGGKSVEALWGDVWAEVRIPNSFILAALTEQQKGHLARAKDLHHEAMAHYEQALSHFPDHPSATVGLSEILLDIYSQQIPPEPVDKASLLYKPMEGVKGAPTASTQSTNTRSNSLDRHAHVNGGADELPIHRRCPPASPEELNRLAARDRAYSLLSSLTKLGSGWDYSEAWFALSRAYEEGGQIEKAKEVLWWTVELEDTRPIRSWEVIGLGGGVL